ncbi:MAG: hypothetical protein ACE5PO_07600 [Candidatus Bathyarchaeia archaeon]
MIFLPRTGAQPTDEGGTGKVVFTVDFFPEAYELTPPDLDSASKLEEGLKAEPRQDATAYRAVDWATKKESFIIIGNAAKTKIQALQDKALKFNFNRIELGAYLMTHEFMRDRGEFEATADILTQCVAELDRMFVGVNLFESKHCLLYVTDKPESRARCFEVVDVALARR